jgi:hypothetical protein
MNPDTGEDEDGCCKRWLSTTLCGLGSCEDGAETKLVETMLRTTLYSSKMGKENTDSVPEERDAIPTFLVSTDSLFVCISRTSRIKIDLQSPIFAL